MLGQVQELNRLMQFQLKLLLWYDPLDQLTSTAEKRNCEIWQNNKVKRITFQWFWVIFRKFYEVLGILVK